MDNSHQFYYYYQDDDELTDGGGVAVFGSRRPKARQGSRDLSTRAKTIHSFEYAFILAVFIVVYL